MYAAMATRMIPLYLLTVAELVSATRKKQLFETNIIRSISYPDTVDERELIETIWHQGKELDDRNCWAYAVALLASLVRCFGPDELVIHIFEADSIGSDACLTPEAKLLQATQPLPSAPIKDIIDIVNSEFGMADFRRDVSRAILQQYWNMGVQE